ncbi:hypothetical protein K470DRAFT_257788 [Piedraia hortae CBS 480.64]|uniref:Smr domain-containing protein n=1 Tax=Piedraia hortae CBS 480.64 TaxID=1314780 RepID=A0A6A7BZR3_9PEZI|nr:hypothetical protein K470DRAFT_257788 [Piedraia hortae CBS 480.64]
MSASLDALQAQYCPPLDPALVLALAYDYNINDPASRRQLCQLLDRLRDEAEQQEASDFDPSGTSNQRDSSSSDTQDTSWDTSTVLSSTITSLDLQSSEGSSVSIIDEIEEQDKTTKLAQMHEIFGDRLSLYSIKYALGKSNWQWVKALEELMNHAYFAEAAGQDRVAAKGIDGFAEDQIVPRTGKKNGKNKKKKKKTDESESPERSLPSPTSPTNKWHLSAQNVEFITSRTNLSTEKVTSAYYAHGASVRKTLIALVSSAVSENRSDSEDEDPVVLVHAMELGTKFPSIPLSQRTALARMTLPSLLSAKELAEIITNANSETIEPIIAQYAPLKFDSPMQDHETIKPCGFIGREQAFAAAREVAFAQVENIRRRARSDKLMKGAVAYYSNLGREFAKLSQAAAIAAVNERAAAQSTPGQVDLHGIDVANAVRIAKEQAEKWWRGLGEERIYGRAARNAGFRIIVGRGIHSKNGKAKIGPAVMKALRAEGWRVEDEHGVLVVSRKGER